MCCSTRKSWTLLADGTVKRIVEPLPPNSNVMTDPDHFAFNAGANLLPRELMDIFQKTQPDFYSALAHLPKEKPKFNPAGQHLRREGRQPDPHMIAFHEWQKEVAIIALGVGIRHEAACWRGSRLTTPACSASPRRRASRRRPSCSSCRSA
jgi:hypothetical protein